MKNWFESNTEAFNFIGGLDAEVGYLLKHLSKPTDFTKMVNFSWCKDDIVKCILSIKDKLTEDFKAGNLTVDEFTQLNDIVTSYQVAYQNGATAFNRNDLGAHELTQAWDNASVFVESYCNPQTDAQKNICEYLAKMFKSGDYTLERHLKSGKYKLPESSPELVQWLDSLNTGLLQIPHTLDIVTMMEVLLAAFKDVKSKL